jgi:hypothetical protein
MDVIKKRMPIKALKTSNVGTAIQMEGRRGGEG